MMEGQKNFIMAMHAKDAQNAFLVAAVDSGGNTEMQGHLTNNGTSFNRLWLPSAGGGMMAMVFFTSVAMHDTNVLFLGGMSVSFPNSKNTLWRSTNGGGSWDVVTEDLPDLPEKLVTLEGGTVLGIAGTQIFRVEGATVSTATVPGLGDRRLADIMMLDDLVGYAAGGTAPTEDNPNVPYGNGFVLKTEDGGNTWFFVSEGIGMKVQSVFFLNEERGWAGGTGPVAGMLFRTDNDGTTWQLQSLPPHPAFTVEMGGIFGNQDVPETPASDITGVRFFDCNRGVALGTTCIGGCDSDNPTFITLFWHTSDAGNTWHFDPDFETVMPGGQMMPQAKVLSSMIHLQFPSVNHGFIAGQHAMVLRYDAAQPEAEAGTPPATCSGSNNNNNNNNDPLNPGSKNTDSGCGCSAGSRPFVNLPLWFFLTGLVLGLSVLRRRKSTPDQK